jgi:DNA polymerase-3 subunit delta'
VIQDSLNENLVNHVLPWHYLQWLRLSSQIDDQALPHAFLFTGVEGVGKELFARNVAAFLLCESSKSGMSRLNFSDQNGAVSAKGACGQCKQCKLFEGDTHPDFKFLEPEEGSSAIKIDQVRHLVDFFSRSSQQGGRKVALLSPAEALNNNAANALLKTLEEPSQGSVIILVSHQSGMLLPTIRSRCQVVDFGLPAVRDSLAWLSANSAALVEGAALKDDDISEILSLAHWAPLKALAYIENGALSEYKLMLEELGSFLKNDCLSSTLAARWNDDLAVLRVSWVMLWLEQIIKLKFGEELSSAHSAKKMFLYLAEKATVLELFNLYECCLKQYRLFLGTSNPNKVLAFELILHDWLALMRKS